MSIKDRLTRKTEGLFQPAQPGQVGPDVASLPKEPENRLIAGAGVSVVSAASPTASASADAERLEPRPPRTGPGQMLAFRAHMQESTHKVQELERKLAVFDGALVQRQLDPARVHPSRWANRHEASYLSPDFDALKLDVQASGGNVQPIRVRPLAGVADAFEIVYGHRRHRACLELGIPVRAVIEDMDDSALFAAMDRENRARRDLSPFEQGEMYRRALDEGLFGSLRQMAQALGVDAGNVSKALGIARLPREVLDVFETPLNIQFRWGHQLHQAMQKDPEGVIARAKAIRSSPKRLTAAEAVGRLLEVSGHQKPAVHVLNVKGRAAGSLTLLGSGAVRIDLLAGRIATDSIPALVQALEVALSAD